MDNPAILVVDDNPANLKLARLLLELEGYVVESANDAEEALEILKSFHPRLILMDLQLPRMDGLELTRRLKRDPTLSDVTIVSLTAYAMKGDKEKALLAGCDGYITKPIDTTFFPFTVARYLAKGRDPEP
jgi:CheY-like chemotaxis protein